MHKMSDILFRDSSFEASFTAMSCDKAYVSHLNNNLLYLRTKHGRYMV
jgi:hypothetical protein